MHIQCYLSHLTVSCNTTSSKLQGIPINQNIGGTMLLTIHKAMNVSLQKVCVVSCLYQIASRIIQLVITKCTCIMTEYNGESAFCVACPTLWNELGVEKK